MIYLMVDNKETHYSALGVKRQYLYIQQFSETFTITVTPVAGFCIANLNVAHCSVLLPGSRQGSTKGVPLHALTVTFVL